MKSQKSAKPTSPSGRRSSRFTLRSRKKKDGVIRGKLRIRSVPGAFLVLGIIVVVVGTALAVAGYWPYRISRSSLKPADGDSTAEAQASGWSLGAKGLLSSSASLVHSERMKLLGPVIMGVGLFILICANTVLYENRDRETQMLLAQMRSVLCSVSAAVPSADLQDIAVANSMSKQYQWVSSLPAAHLNILCVQQLASSEPLLRTRSSREHQDTMEGVYQQVLRTEALHHQELESPPRLQSFHSDSCNSSQTELNTTSGPERRICGIFNLQDATGGKLNNCLLSASSMSTLGVDEVDVPAAAQPRRCHSMSYRTNPRAAWTSARVDEGLLTPGEDGHAERPVRVSREADAQVSVNILEQVAVADAVEQTHRSWPRLDLAAGRRYLKLENKEDSVDKLLDQLELQCSQWDKSFGSGPFQ